MEAVRSVLQPITHALPAPIRDIGISLLGAECYKVIVDDIDLSSTTCLKLAVSKGLGIGIIAAASIVKVPQILKLLKSRSAAGLSLSGTIMETAAYAISIAYNFRNGFPFSTFGETALIVIQNLVIAFLILKYQGKGAFGGALIAGAVAAGVALNNEQLVPAERMKWLQAMTIPLSLASKVPQIYTVWKEGSTGQLSAFAVFNFLAGSLARVFTTIQEVDDPLILYGFLGGAALNAVLAIQMVYYWNSSSKKSSAKKHKKGKKSATSTSADPAMAGIAAIGTAPEPVKQTRVNDRSLPPTMLEQLSGSGKGSVKAKKPAQKKRV